MLQWRHPLTRLFSLASLTATLAASRPNLRLARSLVALCVISTCITAATVCSAPPLAACYACPIVGPRLVSPDSTAHPSSGAMMLRSLLWIQRLSRRGSSAQPQTCPDCPSPVRIGQTVLSIGMACPGDLMTIATVQA